MVKSMTGYGRAVSEKNDNRLVVEVRTVNHRFLDLSVKLPRTLLYLEEKIKKKAKKYFMRGRVDIFIKVEGDGLTKRSLAIDWDLMDQYIKALNEAKIRYQLDGDIEVEDLLQLEEPFDIQEQEEEDDEFEQALLNTLEQALNHAFEMRKEEGKALQSDLEKHIHQMNALVTKLEERREVVIDYYRERIKQRIEEYAQEEIAAEESRVLHEVALLAEKGDISEEVTRLFSHIDQFLTTLAKGQTVGRKLDFIVQEMLRETNTIGSKSNDAKISSWVVTLKSEIEKIKEQVQNVE
ncbi:MAG: YicC family protein [Bacillaceae bacterium]|nr:YicC family protein [Bacillaceae bacterium]